MGLAPTVTRMGPISEMHTEQQTEPILRGNGMGGPVLVAAW